MNPSDLIAILPEIILTCTGIIVILVGAFYEESGEAATAGFTYAGLIGSIAAVAYQFNHPGPAFGGVFLADSFGFFFHLLFLVIALLIVLSSATYLRRERLAAAEYYALILFGTVG